MKTFHFFSCRDIKMTIMTSYFWRKICLFDHVFSQAFPPLIGYHGNNEWPIPKLLVFKDGLYISRPFLRYLAKTLMGDIAPQSK